MRIINSHAKLLIVLLLISVLACSENGGIPAGQEVPAPPSVSETSEDEVRIVNLTEEDADKLNIRTYIVKRDIVTYPIMAPGIVIAAPDHISILSTPVDGRIVKIYAHEGEEVKKGDPLLEMESLEFADLVANFVESRAEQEYLEQQVGRLSRLVEQKISPQSALDRARADLTRSNARVRASSARLKAVGIDDRQLQQWSTITEDERATLTMYAAIDGKINHHLIDLGQAVNANDMLLDIVNNRQVLARGFVSPEDIAFLKPGAKAVISQKTNKETRRSDLSLEAEITTINPGLDRENRSIIVNSIINTQNQWPVIGQTVRFEYEAETPDALIEIPLSAVQFEGKEATVFVKRDELTYEKRTVRLQRMLQESAIVYSGLSPGEEVAVSQVFSLKALGKFEEFAED
jgi:cobalt-zinc-cadmium efflux system membrane fusion protein